MSALEAIAGDDLPASSSAVSIAHELREAIVGGRYGAGEKLPPERRLASHFDASRATIREALRQLAEQRLVERRIGSGTFVAYRATPDQPDPAQESSPLQLIEVRAAIEPQMARLAVLHATNRDLDRLVATLAQVEASHADPAGYSAADERFHLVLAAATGNPLMIAIYRTINEVRRHAQWAAMRVAVLTPANMALYDRQHAAVVEAVRRRDVEAAAAAMVEQMEKARADLVGAHSR